MSDVDDMVARAQKQLDEHKVWLVEEIEKLPLSDEFTWDSKLLLLGQVAEMRVRVAMSNGRVASVIHEYPDELYAYLRSAAAPDHLRASVADGHVVDPNQPAFTARREL